MGEKLFFSVIVPMFNSEANIANCIKSIQDQSYSNFEVIIVNDNSTDNSKFIVEKIIKDDERIKLVNQENKGAFHARIAGVKKSVGKYMIFLDTDDTLKPFALEVIEKEMINNEVDVLMYGAEAIDQNGNIIKFKPLFENGKIFNYNNKMGIYKSFLNSVIPINVMWIKAIKRELLLEYDYTDGPRISLNDDLLYSLGPITTAKKIMYIDKVLYEYRYNSESITRNFQPNVYEGIKYVYKHLAVLLEKWEIDNEKQDLFYQKYVATISNLTLYSSNSVVKKHKSYFEMLKSISDDLFFVEVYKETFTKLKLKYKLPLFLLKTRCFKTIFLMKILLNIIFKYRK